MTDLALDISHVTKTFPGDVRALRDVSMSIRRGEVFGLLGPNGAGKSTLVKVLMTVISPTSAAGMLLGRPIGHKPTLARVGYLPEHHRFPDYLTGRQVVEFYGALAGVPARERRERAAKLLDFVGMSRWATVKVRKYSKGMRQRVGIAQALVNNPEFVVLDEPTDGVDPVGRRDIRAMVADLKAYGTTVLLNSHLLSELEMVCDRVAILVRGQVASQGTLDELTRGKQYYEIELAHHDPADEARVRTLLQSRPAMITGGTIKIPTTDPAEAQPYIDAVRAAGEIIRAVRPVRPSLEDLFMAAVTDPTTGAVLAPGAIESPGRGSTAQPSTTGSTP